MSAVQNIAVPPHNIEAEKSVLGAVLLDERHLYALLIEEHLRPEHFYREQYGEVFGAMIDLHSNDRKIDHLTVAETLRQRGKLEEVGGAEAIDELTGWVPAAGHARDYGRIVRDNARLRALLDMPDAAPDALLRRLAGEIRAGGRDPGRTGSAEAAEALAALTRLRCAVSNPRALGGVR